MDSEEPVLMLQANIMDSPVKELSNVSKLSNKGDEDGELAASDGTVVNMEKTNDTMEKETGLLITSDNVDKEATLLTNSQTLNGGVNVKTNSCANEEFVMSSTTAAVDNVAHSSEELNTELEMEVNAIDEKHSPKKRCASRVADSIEADIWETVEPVADSASGVRRSGRKRRRRRISYTDLLEDNENSDSNSNKHVKNEDDDWNYDGKVESLNVDKEKPSPSPSPSLSPLPAQSVTESTSKRKVAVRRGEKKNLETDGESNDNERKEEKDAAKHYCENCDVVFVSQKQFKKHRLTCTTIQSLSNHKTNSRCIGGSSGQVCPICRKKFFKLNGVKRHMTLQHTNLVHISCALCSKKIGDVTDNFNHFQEEHQNSFPQQKKGLASNMMCCPVCGDVVNKYTQIKHHLVNSHSNLIHVTCSLCDRGVGTMLEYYQHFVRYHSHFSITRDKKKEVVTTNNAITSTSVISSSDKNEKSGLVCLQCKKTIENHNLFFLHMLSHKVDDNTDIVGQNSRMQTLPVPDCDTDQNSCSKSTTDSNGQADFSVLNPTKRPLDEYPLPVWWLPPEAVNTITLTSASALLGPDLVMSINRSLNTMTEMSTKLISELDWSNVDYLYSKMDLVRRLNKLLQFSSGITDIGKCLLLVLEECLQLKENPYFENNDSGNAVQKEEVEDEGLMISFENDQETDVDSEDDNIEPSNVLINSESKETLERAFTSNDGDEPHENTAIEKEQLNTADSISDLNLVECSDTPDQTIGDDLENQSEKTSELEGSVRKNTSDMKKKPRVSQDTERRSSQRLKAKDSSSKRAKLKKGRKKFVCKICGKQLTKKSGLANHLLIHSDARPFQCQKCSASFKAEHRLKRHYLVHLKDEQFKCDFCSFSHRLLSFVQKHSLEEHPNSALFSCDLCKYKARTSHDLAHHKKIHEPRKCKLCDFEAIHLYALRAHERKIHTNKFCPHCPYSCWSNYQLKRHIQRHVKSEVDPIYCCELCGATFDSYKRLNYHVIRHTNKTPYSCAQCDYKCSSKQSYNAHMLKHSGLRPYKCSLCDADFIRTSHLRNHMLIHSDEKKFCCTYCGKGFKYKYNWQEHEMIHTGEKKFKCKICNFACRRRKFLDQHLKEHKERGSDVECRSDNEDGAATVAFNSGLMLKTENSV